MPTLLLTGFDKWHNKPYNASWEMLAGAELQLPNRWEAVIQKLPVSWEDAPQQLQRAITEDVKATVCFGMGGGNEIRCERIAVNLIDPLLRDVDGLVRGSEYVVPGGPPAYWTRLPFRRVLHALETHKIPCALSHHAGAYLCNYLFYWLLHHLTENERDIVAGFIHVPPLDDLGGLEKSTLSRAANIIANTVVEFADGRSRI